MGRRRGNNEGTVFQDKDGVWWAQLTPDDRGRRPKRRATTQREAQEKLRELMRQRDKGVNLGAKQLTVAELLKLWLAEIIKPHRKPRTYENYLQHVNLYIVPFIGNILLNKLTTARIQSWVNELKTRVSAQTTRNAFQRVRTALMMAIRWRYLTENPAIGVETPSPRRVPIRPLNADQAKALLDAVAGHRLSLLYLLAVRLGLRQGELVGLRWSNVDLAKGVLKIAEQVQRLRSLEIVSVAPKTPKSIRELPLSTELVTLLREHLQMLHEEQAMVGERWQDYNLVFPSEVGTPMIVRNLLRHYKGVLKQAGLPSTTRFHDLRHTAATLLLGAGVPIKTVSDILGHSSIQVTVDTYGYTFDEDKQRALDTLAQTLTRRD